MHISGVHRLKCQGGARKLHQNKNSFCYFEEKIEEYFFDVVVVKAADVVVKVVVVVVKAVAVVAKVVAVVVNVIVVDVVAVVAAEVTA